MKAIYHFLFPCFVLLMVTACNNSDNNNSQTNKPTADSLKADSLAEAENQLDIIGEWNVIQYGTETLDTGVMIIHFQAEGKMSMTTSEGTDEARYVISEDQQSIEVTAENKPETWTIKSLTKNELLIDAEYEVDVIEVKLVR